MLWFRLASAIFLTVVLIMSMGVTAAIVQMCSYGSSTKSMVDDPTKNGTISIYVTLVSVEVFVLFCSLFGMFVAISMWRNNYQIDHSLRHQFIIWLGCWAIGFAFCLIIGIYMIIRSKDSQESMAVLYDTFFRNSQDQKFVATFEKFQREFQCCGIYSPNDWFIIQFRQRSGGAGGGGGGFQDYDGYNQNPSTGKCHLTPPTVPPGCGTRLNDEIQFLMKIYAACAICQTILGAFTGGLFWYCFFYWLEKEVIVIPEDEVSNLIIIEPESEVTINLSSTSSFLSSSRYLSSRSRLAIGSHSGRGSHHGSYLRDSYIHSSKLPSGMRTKGGSYLHPGSYMGHSPQRSHSHHHHDHHHHHHKKLHLSHTAILHEQEEALGGKVLAEMHVSHKSTKMLQAKGSNAGQHHATVAIVRNTNPPPKPDLHKGFGHHGQTGNLARDIADMSGKSARGYIEDVVIPPGPPGKKLRPIQIPLGASVHSRPPSPSPSQDHHKNIKAHSMQNQIEGMMHVFSQDKAAAKKSHKSVVIERKDHHPHHKKKKRPVFDSDDELSAPRLLPALGSHEDNSHHKDHNHGHHQHGHEHDHHHDHDHHQHHGSHHHQHGYLNADIFGGSASRHSHNHHHHGSNAHHLHDSKDHHHHGSKDHHHHGSKDHHHHGSKDHHHGSKDHHHGSKDHHHGSKDHHHGSKDHHHHGSKDHHNHNYQKNSHAGHEHNRHSHYGHGHKSHTHHHQHGHRMSSRNANRHHSPHRRRSKDFRYGTTVLFKNPKNLDDSD